MFTHTLMLMFTLTVRLTLTHTSRLRHISESTFQKEIFKTQAQS